MKTSLDCSTRTYIYIPQWTRLYVSMKYTPVSKLCPAVTFAKRGGGILVPPREYESNYVVIRMLQSRRTFQKLKSNQIYCTCLNSRGNDNIIVKCGRPLFTPN